MAQVFSHWEITPGVTFTNGSDANSPTAHFKMPAANVTATAVFEEPPPLNQFTDPRDGKTYRTVQIGSQVWMAENLDWAGSGVYYNNASSPPFAKAGRLYTWQEAMAAAPTGWHLPTDAEWTTLALYAGGTGTYGESGTAGTALKAASGWNSNGNGTDQFGFSALPGGNGNTDGSFLNVGNYGYWWTASELDASSVL